MKNPVVVAVRAIEKLSPAEFKLVLSLARPQGGVVTAPAPAPVKKARKKPGPKPGAKKAAAAALDKKFPPSKRISTEEQPTVN